MKPGLPDQPFEVDEARREAEFNTSFLKFCEISLSEAFLKVKFSIFTKGHFKFYILIKWGIYGLFEIMYTAFRDSVCLKIWKLGLTFEIKFFFAQSSD